MQQAAAVVNQRNMSQLTKFKFGGDNRQQFLSGFPEVAAHLGFTALIYDDPPVARSDADEEGVQLADIQEWDRINAFTLCKFKFYFHKDIYKIVWKGDTLAALEFYQQ